MYVYVYINIYVYICSGFVEDSHHLHRTISLKTQVSRTTLKLNFLQSGYRLTFSCHPSLIFHFQFLPPPVHPTKFCFHICSGFIRLVVMEQQNMLLLSQQQNSDRARTTAKVFSVSTSISINLDSEFNPVLERRKKIRMKKKKYERRKKNTNEEKKI